MSKRTNKEFLLDIQEAASRIANYVKGMSYADFLEDEKTQDAVVRNIEIIGEAVKELLDDFKAKHDDIEWKYIARMRDKLIHHYHGVSWEIVWSVVKNDLPDLKSKVDNIIDNL